MESYCLKFKKYTKNINPQILVLVMVKWWYYRNVQYAVVKNQNLLKKQAKGLLSKLGNETPLSKVPLLGDILF